MCCNKLVKLALSYSTHRLPQKMRHNHEGAENVENECVQWVFHAA
jgi:hypothetical protein